MRLHGRSIYHGNAKGEALVSLQPISFFGGIDPETGVVVERGHALEGQSIAGKVLVFPTGKGSTVGSCTLYRLKVNGHAPLAILNSECEPIIAVGCIIAEIPCVDQLPIHEIPPGSQVVVDGDCVSIEEPVESTTNGVHP
jgi:predicted aconitase with swiveling domain